MNESARMSVGQGVGARAKSADKERSLSDHMEWEEALVEGLPMESSTASPSEVFDVWLFMEQNQQWWQLHQQFGQQGQAELWTAEYLEHEASAWWGRCWICHVQGQVSDHELYYCQQPQSQAARQWMLRVRNQIRYPRHVSCFRCGMPQTICPPDQWQAGGRECTYCGALIPMVAVMLYGPRRARIQHAWAEWLRGFGVASTDESWMVQFLGDQAEGQVYTKHTNLVQTFCWLWQICEDQGLICR